MAPVLCLNKGNVRVGAQPRPRLGVKPHKRIIRGAQHQRRNRDALDHPRRRRPVVVIIRVFEVAIAGHNLMVKLAQRAHRANLLRVINLREKLRLAPESPHQPSQELPLVDAIPRLMQRIAKESGAKIGGTLFSDQLSPPGGPAATYIAMMEHNISELKKALVSPDK